MKKNLLSIVFVFTCLYSSAQWQHTSCTSSNGSMLAVGNGDTVYQATSGMAALNRSDNGGANWTQVKSFLTATVYSMAASGSTVLVHAFPDGQFNPILFKSTNFGNNWTNAGTGLPTNSTNTMVFSAWNAFHAGTAGAGSYQSSDKGDNWSIQHNGIETQNVTAILQSSPDFVGTDGGGVFLDDIGGFFPINTGLTDLHVTALTGSSWNDCFIGTKDSGVFRFDFTIQSKPINAGLTNRHIKALVMSGNMIFAGTAGGGVFMSNDNGANWAAINDGLTDLDIISLAVNNTTLFAGITSNKGVWKRPLADFTSTSVTSVNKNTSLSIYPNPSPGIFNLQINSPGKIKISVSNLLGEVINSSIEENTNVSLKINLKNAASGIYFLQAETESGEVLQKKLVKE